MSSRRAVDMTAAPRSLERIESASAHLSAPIDAGAGRFIRALAGSKPGGVFLQAGAGSPTLSAWLLDGMDITSRLITVIGDEALLGAARETIGEDIRVAIHRQALGEFLHDIRAHALQLVAFDAPPAEIEVLEAALALLAPGGLLVVLGATPSAGAPLLESLTANERFHSAAGAGPGDLLLVVRRAVIERRVRRGRRRAGSTDEAKRRAPSTRNEGATSRETKGPLSRDAGEGQGGRNEAATRRTENLDAKRRVPSPATRGRDREGGNT